MKTVMKSMPVEQYRGAAERTLRAAMREGFDIELTDRGRVVLRVHHEDLSEQDFETRPADLAGTVLAQADLTEPTTEAWTTDEGDEVWEPPDAAP